MIYEILTCDVPSQFTNRIYPKDVVEAAVERYNLSIENGSSIGMLGDHPHDFPLEIDLLRASHTVTSMYIEDGKVKATINVLSTTHGKILQRLLDSNSVRLSPIMIGMVNEVGSDYVISNLTIIGTSFVIDDKSSLPQITQYDLFEEIPCPSNT